MLCHIERCHTKFFHILSFRVTTFSGTILAHVNWPSFLQWCNPMAPKHHIHARTHARTHTRTHARTHAIVAPNATILELNMYILIKRCIQSLGLLKALHTSPPGQLVQSNAISTSPGMIQSRCNCSAKTIRSFFYNQVLIYYF